MTTLQERHLYSRTDRSDISLLLLVIFCLLINIAIVLFLDVILPDQFRALYGYGNFPDGYGKLASNIALGNGYRFFSETAETLMREPAYPLFLAAFFKIFGHGIIVAQAANLLLALGIVIVMACLARRLCLSPATIALSVVLFLFHPGTVIAETRAGVEMLFGFSVTLFLWLLCRCLSKFTLFNIATTGAALGLCCLIRGTPLIFPFVLLAYLLIFARRLVEWKSSALGILVMTAAMVVVLSPWVGRNYLLVQKVIPTASVLGVAAHAGSYICENWSTDKGYKVLDNEASKERAALAKSQGLRFKGEYYQFFYEPRDELRFNEYLTTQVARTYWNDPALYISCTARNIANFWVAGKSWKSSLLNMTIQIPFVGFAIFGSWLLYRRGNGQCVGPLILFIVYCMAVHAAIHAQARYSVPLIPILALLSATGLTAVKSKLWTPSRSLASAPGN